MLALASHLSHSSHSYLVKKSYDDYVNVHLLYNIQPYMCQ